MRRVCICENVHFRFIYTPCYKTSHSYCISYNYTALYTLFQAVEATPIARGITSAGGIFKPQPISTNRKLTSKIIGNIAKRQIIYILSFVHEFSHAKNTNIQFWI